MYGQLLKISKNHQQTPQNLQFLTCGASQRQFLKVAPGQRIHCLKLCPARICREYPAKKAALANRIFIRQTNTRADTHKNTDVCVYSHKKHIIFDSIFYPSMLPWSSKYHKVSISFHPSVAQVSSRLFSGLAPSVLAFSRTAALSSPSGRWEALPIAERWSLGLCPRCGRWWEVLVGWNITTEGGWLAIEIHRNHPWIWNNLE